MAEYDQDGWLLCTGCYHPVAMHSILNWKTGHTNGPCRSHIDYAGNQCGCTDQIEQPQIIM